MIEELQNGEIVEITSAGKQLASHVKITRSWWSRAKGLLGTRSLAESRGIWIFPCDSIHMFGMLYRIDVLFLCRDMRVVKIKRGVWPFGFALGGKTAVSALELSSNNCLLDFVSVGDQIGFKRI